MKKKLFHNWTLKLASLILAFALWFVVIQIEKPMDTATFSNIKVTLINTELLEEKNKVYEVLENSDKVTRVTVKAPRSITDKLRAGDIVAEADVSKLTNINTIAIKYYVLNEDVYSITGNRDVVKLNVEDKKSKWIRVRSETIGEVAEGYMITNASPDQTMIEITGPQSAVEQVSYAGVQIGVAGATNSLSANVEVTLYNDDGEALHLPSIITNVNYIHMSVEVMAIKEVPVEIHYTGEPADGYLVAGNVERTPATVMLAGNLGVLNNVSKIAIPAEVLDITGATESIVKTINLKDYLPENVQLANSSYNGRLKLTVPIEKRALKNVQIPIGNIGVRNLPEGFTSAFPSDLMECVLTVSGLSEDVTALKYYDITGYIDVTAWMVENDITKLEEGNYNMPVTFELNKDIDKENDVTLQLQIREADRL